MGNFNNDVEGNQGAVFSLTYGALMGAKTIRVKRYELLFRIE